MLALACISGYVMNEYEYKHITKWLSKITNHRATMGDLQKYIDSNKIHTKARLLNKLHADFVKLPG